MKTPVIFSLFLCFSISCFAQDINLFTQTDVDGFDPNTTIINGYLNIVGNTNPSIAITDLSNLSNLTTITGDLIIQEHSILNQIDNLNNITTINGSLDIKNNTSINHIDGLSNLTTLGNNLYIEYNDLLPDIDGLNGLNNINGDVEITYNPLLTNIDGLSNIPSYNGDFILFQNVLLENLNALSNVTSISGDLNIAYCNTLTNLNELSNLTSIGNDLRISRNDELIDINGLLGITTLHDLYITYNQALPNIDGLTNLNTITNYINIGNNPALANINGLSNITTIGTEIEISANNILNSIDPLLGLTTTSQDIIIKDNPALTDINGLANVTTIGGDLWLSNNSLITNVNSLSNLTTINNDLVILQHENLVDLTGLSNLTHVENSIFIRDNIALPHLDGLSNIASIINRLFITDNSSLSNINGLSGITEISGDIWITDNPALENINGLSNITSVMDDIRIDNNDMLTNLNGFCGLVTMGNMTIVRNDALLNMDGLANFSSTITYLDIDDNASINNLDGLSQVSNIANWLRVRNNPNLNNCCGIQYLVATPGAIGLFATITGNPSECSSENDITNAFCANTCTINIAEILVGECSGNTYDVDIKIIANYGGTSNTYLVSDGTNTYGPFSYGSDEIITLPADGNIYTLVFSDSDNANCNNQIEVSQDACSDDCVLTIDTYVIGNCNDNETNSDPSDDSYQVSFNASALNFGTGNLYTVSDENNVYGTFIYENDETITLPADGNIYTLVFTDVDDDACSAEIEVSQESCSNTCLLTIDSYFIGSCDDNGTNTDPSDDIYQVNFNTSALNVGTSNSYTVSDDNNAYGTFTYGNDESIILPADGSTYTLTFADTDDVNCFAEIDVSQVSCSDLCLLNIENYFIGDCNDNGTSTDPSDDYYDVGFYASALNAGASNSYTVTNGNTSYGIFTYENNETITLPADGNTYTLTFSDNDHAVCLSIIDVSQESCSSTSIQDLEQSGVSIYPNPFHDGFEISSIDHIKIESIAIHDVIGRLIKQIHHPAYGFIDFPDAPTGVYFIVLQTEKSTFSGKILKL